MHSLFKLLFISFLIASTNVVRASELPDNVDFVPYVKASYFDTQRDDGPLLSDFSENLESRSLGGVSINELFARQIQNGRISDLQTFTGALGGIKAPSIVRSSNKERPYQVEGNMFPNYMEAATRTCDIQNNDCSDMVNAQGAADDGDGEEEQVTTTTQNRPSTTSRTTNTATTTKRSNGNQQLGDNNNANGTVGVVNNKRQNRVSMDMCNQQMAKCNSVVRSAAIQSFDLVNVGPDPNDPDFDLLCAP